MDARVQEHSYSKRGSHRTTRGRHRPALPLHSCHDERANEMSSCLSEKDVSVRVLAVEEIDLGHYIR